MRFSTTFVLLCVFSLLFIQIGSLDVFADAENDDEFGPCWGNEWNDFWWGIGMLGMMAVMTGGILVIFIVFLYVLGNGSFQLPNILGNKSIQYPSVSINGSQQRPPPMYNPTLKLDERYARGEISREEYISQSLDEFINRFADEK